MTNRPSRPRGFTLIELLMVIAIIAILIALLLPAVQQAREAARRTQCRNNLKQLGLALHNYHDAHKVFPPGSVGSNTSLYTCSWLVLILPYVDQATVYNKYNFVSYGGYTVNNAMLRGVVIPGFRCPTNSLPDGMSVYSNSPDVMIPDYVGITGAVMPDGSSAGGSSAVRTMTYGHIASNGTLVPNARINMAKLVDGSSNTFMVGEQCKRWVTSAGGSYISYDMRGGYYFGFAMGAYSNTVGIPADGWSGDMPSCMVTTIKHPVGHNIPSSTTSDGIMNSAGAGYRSQNVGVGSDHAGGVHMLRCDGSVQFVSENVSMQTFRNYCIRDDGNVAGEL